MNRMIAGWTLLGAVAAAVAGQAPEAAPAAPSLQDIAGQYQVDRLHTSVVFKVKHLNVSYFYGTFTDSTGTFSITGPDGSGGSFEIQVKADSVNTRNEGRDNHLKGPDFFNARQYPTLTFKSSQVVRAPDGTFDVTGDLTIHGVTRPLTAKLVNTGAGPGMEGEYRVGFETQFTVKRADFGMDFMLDKLGNEVQILFSVEGVKK